MGAVAIESAVYTILAADLGDNDLTSRVTRGVLAAPPSLPWAHLDFVSVTTEDDSAPMGTYEHTARWEIQAWAAVTAMTGAASISSSLALANEIQTAVHAQFLGTSGTLKALGVRRCNFTDAELMNTEIGGRLVGHVRMTLEIRYTTTGGI